MMRLLLALAISAAAPLLQFRTNVDVVRVEALVLDDGRPVAGLTAADFVVTDNGAAQSVRVRAIAGTREQLARQVSERTDARGGVLQRIGLRLRVVDQLPQRRRRRTGRLV